MKSAIVITPTTGSEELIDAAISVQAQTYPNTDHLVVVDGAGFQSATNDVLSDASLKTHHLYRANLPFNVGANGFYGHRIMAAFGHLVNHDYVLFLDQDNWLDPNHVETLVELCEVNKLDWSYSLRKIYDKDKNYICEDNCESLGKWPIFNSDDQHLIDSSSYCFSLPFLRQVCHLWDHGWGADRRFYTILKDHIKHTNYDCSKKYSLNYRLGGNEGSVKAEFFLHGNAITEAKYGNKYPWH